MPGVSDAVHAARSALDPLLLDRKLRTHGQALAATVALQNAHASATLEGADVPLDELRSGIATSPMVRAAIGVLEAQTMLRALSGQPARQVWAQLAVVAGREYLEEDLRGRPRGAGDALHDPLHLKHVADPDDVAVRLAMLADLLQQPTTAPALVVAAIAHALGVDQSTVWRWMHAETHPRASTLARMGPRLAALTRRATSAGVTAELGAADQMEVHDVDER